MPLTRSKRLAFAAVTVTLSLMITIAAFFALDVYLHHRYARSFGVNLWGYRGERLGDKVPGERRIAVVGGSTAFGYGVDWQQAMPWFLERYLNPQRPATDGVFTVANLASNGEGAYSFKYTLRDYEYLDYDVALLYTGVNDLGGENRAVTRHGSGVFRLTGYLPLMPLVFAEKALALRHDGDLDAAYGEDNTVFVANPRNRFTAAALDGAVAIVDGVEQQLGLLAGSRTADRIRQGRSCGPRWQFYCQQIHDAVRVVLDAGRRALVVSEPYLGESQIEQQRLMVQMLRMEFGDDPRLGYLDLGRVVDPTDSAVSWDGMHLRPASNEVVARHLVEPVRALLGHSLDGTR